MAEKDSFQDLRHAKEEEYFHRKEQELREKLHRSAAEAAGRRELGTAAGIADEAILGDLQELGFSRDTVGLLHLVPLVEVAWADGQVSATEREQIIGVARTQGVKAGSPADATLVSWLDKRPGSDFFGRSLAVIRALLAGLPEDRRQAARTNLLAQCHEIAAASRGFLGLGSKVSGEERQLLDRLAGELSRTHADAARRVTGQV